MMRCLLKHLIIPLFKKVPERIEAFWSSSRNNHLAIFDGVFRSKLAQNQFLII